MHAAVDLFGHGGLLFCSTGDLRVHRVDGPDQLRHGIEGRPGFVGLGRGAVAGIAGAAHGLHGRLGALLQAVDHALDFLGTLLGAAGQCADFIGHHRKATPGFTGTGGFNGGVEGQQVGLLGNRADHPEHADNRRHVLLQAIQGHATAADVIHQRMNLRDAAIHHALGGLAFGVGLLRRHGRALGTAGHFMGGRRHFIDRRRHLVGFLALAFHGLFRAMGLLGHLADQPGQLRGHVSDLAYQAMDLVDKPIERAGQFTQLVLAGDCQAPGQVALTGGDIVEVGFHQVQGAQDGIGQQHARCSDQQQQDYGDADNAQQHPFHALVDLGFDFADQGLDTVEVDRSTDHHVPLGQVLGVAELGHQFGLPRLGRAVLQVVGAILADLDQVAVDVDAVGVTVVLEAFAHAVGAVALEQADGFGVVAEEIAVLAVGCVGQQLDHLRPRLRIAGGCGVVQRLDGGHRHFDITLQGGLGVIEQALAGFGHLGARLFLEDPHGGQADDHGKQQHWQYSEGQDFGLQTQTHGSSLL